ncbi:MAG: Hsp33 family molecular chaperone HslO [Acetobacterales bacterium]
MTGYAPLGGDFILPFHILDRYIRGRMICLGSLADEIVSRHDYPAPVCSLLGEALALTAGLASTLKFDGTFSVQTRSDGPVKMLLTDVTNTGEMRAYARFDSGRLAEVLSDAGEPERLPVPRLLGAGHIAFTVDRGGSAASYQGIVDLSGSSLAECAHTYFRTSEQLDCAIKIAAGRGPWPEGNGRSTAWRAGCLLLERLPADTRDESVLEQRDEDWRRAVILLGSCSDAELLDPHLPKEDLLHRLFHEEGLRVMEARGLSVGCRCSRERVENVLLSFPRGELEDMKVDGRYSVTCEFCGRSYEFEDADLHLDESDNQERRLS